MNPKLLKSFFNLKSEQFRLEAKEAYEQNMQACYVAYATENDYESRLIERDEVSHDHGSGEDEFCQNLLALNIMEGNLLKSADFLAVSLPLLISTVLGNTAVLATFTTTRFRNNYSHCTIGLVDGQPVLGDWVETTFATQLDEIQKNLFYVVAHHG